MPYISNYKVNQILLEWQQEGTKSAPPLMFKIQDDEVHLYTPRPGVYIGKAGCLIYKYRDKLKSEIPAIKDVKIFETQLVHDMSQYYVED